MVAPLCRTPPAPKKEFATPFKKIYDIFNVDTRNQDLSALARHSGMPLAGIHSAVFLDSG